MWPSVHLDVARHTTPHRFLLRCSLPRTTRASSMTLAPARHAPGPRGFDPRIARPPAAAIPRRGPILRALPLLSPYLTLYLASTDSRAPSWPLPQPSTPSGCLVAATSADGRMCRGASGRPQPSQGHPRARSDASGARVPPLPAGTDRPRPLLPYVVNACFKYFRRFRDMLQLFHMDVAKRNRRYCICCKCFRGML
jgi:hypothetical protein